MRLDVVIGFVFVLNFPEGSSLPRRNSIRGIYHKAAVASDNGICSDIGKSILKKGGNAVDAIIASAVCIGVADPQSSGLGGGHFLTVYNRTTKTCTIFDARERAPGKASENLYKYNKTASLNVPGELHGFWTAYKQFGGKVPWKDLWAPTIELCRSGIKVAAPVAKALRDEAKGIENDSDFDIFKHVETGEYVKENETMKRLVLASTMEQIANAENPVDLFYNSDLTSDMVEEITKNGGIITKEDFQNYTTRFGQSERPPIYSHLVNGYTFCAPPPPSSGSLITSVLNVLDGYHLNASNLADKKRFASAYHKLIETLKFTYGIRYNFADMDYLSSAQFLAESVNYKSYGSYLRDRISVESSFKDPSYYGSSTVNWDSGTSHMSVVDEYGNAASMTSTINTYFGAKTISKVTGVIYNNEMDDFSLSFATNFFNITPSAANKLVPGKRPQSSMSPVIGFDQKTGDVKLVLGAAGGSKIISAVAQVVVRVLYFMQNIKEAIDAPRIHNQLQPFDTFYEPEFSDDIVQQLERNFGQIMNPNMSTFSSVVVGVHRMPNGSLEANSDFRKPGGYPAGY